MKLVAGKPASYIANM